MPWQIVESLYWVAWLVALSLSIGALFSPTSGIRWMAIALVSLAALFTMGDYRGYAGYVTSRLTPEQGEVVLRKPVDGYTRVAIQVSKGDLAEYGADETIAVIHSTPGSFVAAFTSQDFKAESGSGSLAAEVDLPLASTVTVQAQSPARPNSSDRGISMFLYAEEAPMRWEEAHAALAIRQKARTFLLLTGAVACLANVIAILLTWRRLRHARDVV